MHANLHLLNQHFGIEDVLHFSGGEGGLWRALITTEKCTAELYRHGAHLTRWRPRGHDEVIWLSQQARYLYDKAIRGGVPICFPWFAGNQPAYDPDGPAHGYARVTTWEFIDAKHDADGVTLSLRTETEPCFTLRYDVTFGDTLTMRLTATNTGSAPATFESALHTYFVISQIKQVQVTGLENADYIDTVGGNIQSMTQDDQPIKFESETDRTYTSDATTKIIDTGLQRTITIEKQHSGSTVVWNPWTDKAKAMADFGDDEWPGMLCVESGNIQPNAITLEPEQSHTMQAVIRVEALA
ncbi:MAG: D-hexose-6-phosphate mutarotase [Phycisphaeraceae bacterium]|nr:D-hexose-6-phosphate mutarotase [Phycisphaeraceae bacterium]